MRPTGRPNITRASVYPRSAGGRLRQTPLKWRQTPTAPLYARPVEQPLSKAEPRMMVLPGGCAGVSVSLPQTPSVYEDDGEVKWLGTPRTFRLWLQL
jgi:hypothetical protein